MFVMKEKAEDQKKNIWYVRSYFRITFKILITIIIIILNYSIAYRSDYTAPFLLMPECTHSLKLSLCCTAC